MHAIIRVLPPTGVETSPAVPGLALHQNSPNPFNPVTKIVFEVPGSDGDRVSVSLRVYDLQGRHVRSLVSGSLPAARHDVIWDGRDDAGLRVSTGVYLYRLVAGELTTTRTMTMIK